MVPLRSAPAIPYLHFINTKRDTICRCTHQYQHERWHSVEDPLLIYLVNQYFNAVDYVECFQREWEARLITLHYTSANKVCVCRCSNPTYYHGHCRPVHNVEIRKLTEMYYGRNGEELLCTKSDWRAMIGVGSVPRSATFRTAIPDDFRHLKRAATVAVPEAEFRSYDSAHSLTLDPRRWAGVVDKDEALSVLTKYRRGGILENDIGIESGSLAPPPTMVTSLEPRASTSNTYRAHTPSSTVKRSVSSPLRDLGLSELEAKTGQQSYNFGNAWSGEVSTAIEIPKKAPPPSPPFPPRTHSTSSISWHPSKPTSMESLTEGVYDLELSIGRLSFNPWDVPEGRTTSLKKLKTASALPAVAEEEENDTHQPSGSHPAHSAPYTYNHPTPNEDYPGAWEAMERQNPCHDSEVSRIPLRVDRKHVTFDGPETLNHDRVSKLFAQESEESLPEEENFFSNHVTVCSAVDPPRAGAACKICRTLFHFNTRKRTLRMKTCGHHFHDECLRKWFRGEDRDFGTCPTCNKPLCERTFVNRVMADKGAVFGSQFTNLESVVNIDLPGSSSKYVTCRSEEQLAAVQLRFLKGNVDRTIDEAWIRYLPNRQQLDWYSIIRAAFDQFKEDGMPVAHCRYIPDEPSFVKYILWMELVRLMNKAKATFTQDEESDALFPSLKDLHKKFLMAKDRYNKEKETWRKHGDSVLPCDLIAQDMYQACMASFPARKAKLT